VLIIGNSKSFHLGAQDTFNPNSIINVVVIVSIIDIAVSLCRRPISAKPNLKSCAPSSDPRPSRYFTLLVKRIIDLMIRLMIRVNPRRRLFLTLT